MKRPHRPDLSFPCNCDDCSRAAAARWMGLMERVHRDELTLREAQLLDAKGLS